MFSAYIYIYIAYGVIVVYDVRFPTVAKLKSFMHA